MLGALTRVAGMDVDAMRKAMLEVIPRFHEENLRALDLGYTATRLSRWHDHYQPLLGLDATLSCWRSSLSVRARVRTAGRDRALELPSPQPSPRGRGDVCHRPVLQRSPLRVPPERLESPWQRPPSDRPSHPWSKVWPPHLPHTLDYPLAPAWWILGAQPRQAPRAHRDPLSRPRHPRRARDLTYAALATRARALAVGLQRLGVGRGRRVAVCLPNSPALITSFYGTWLAGATVVPINPVATRSELMHQLGASRPRCSSPRLVRPRRPLPLLVKCGCRWRSPRRMAAHRRGRHPFEQLVVEDGRQLKTAAIDASEDVAVILYTGGTSGAPKGRC